jgi:1,6-anhydro-N-acetylmuramate kinase
VLCVLPSYVANEEQCGSIPTLQALRNHILTALREVQRKPSTITSLNILLGYMFSNGIKSFCEKYGIPIASIDLVGTHVSGMRGHEPPKTNDITKHPLGWNDNIVAQTGISTAFDLAVIEGGTTGPHVSPLAFVDKLFLRHTYKFRACINIGELVNCNFIPPIKDETVYERTTRDCGPGSLLIDYAMRYCTSNVCDQDNNGKFASSGKVDQAIVTQFFRTYDYCRFAPSPNIAREMFGDHEAQRLIEACLSRKLSDADTVATVTRITAENILRQYRRLLAMCFSKGQKVDELFISGPSARNANIIDCLEAELPESVITKPLDDIGIPGDSNEAVCYAHLALEAVLGQAGQGFTTPLPCSIPPKSDIVLGKIVRGNGWDELSSGLLRFSGGETLNITTDVRVAGSFEKGMHHLGLG